MRRFAILLLLVAILSGSAGPVLAEPAFGNNCLSCHSQLQTDKLVIFGQDTMADPNESATGAPDRGVLPVFQALRGQVKAFHAQVENLSANDTYAVQLTRLRYPGVENGGTLVYEGDCDWPEWGESAVYYSEPVVACHWSEGPASFAFDISVAPGAGADYYDLLFAVAGMFDSDGGPFYAAQHFYVQVLPTRVGDIDADGNVDYVDLSLFVQVLLGLDPSHISRADMNGDGVANGKDVQLFVDAMMAGK